MSERSRRTYTPHAQLIVTEEWLGRREEPSPEQLAVIEEYREKYLQTFGAYPAGSHYIDSLDCFVALLRPGGLPTALPGSTNTH
jgi:hypothetical protein